MESNLAHQLPLFRRSHGAFTARNEEVIEDFLRRETSHVIFDPFLGRGRFLLSHLRSNQILYGAELLSPIWLLAYLEQPEVRNNLSYFCNAAKELLESLKSATQMSPKVEYSEEWLQERQIEVIEHIAAAIGFPEIPDTWPTSENAREDFFTAAVVVASARLFSCWRPTRNATWTKPGGIPVLNSPVESTELLLAAMLERNESVSRLEGRVRMISCDVTSPGAPRLPAAPDLIVTSPPYANGHNYARQWGPELAVSAAMGFRGFESRLSQLGVSTVGHRFEEVDLELLPERIRIDLAGIYSSDIKDSSTYYFRRFVRYAIDLKSSIDFACQNLGRKPSKAIIVVRDTRHGDTMFHTGQLVIDLMVDHGWNVVDEPPQLIRTHIGNKRPVTSRYFGNAQVEWLLRFER